MNALHKTDDKSAISTTEVGKNRKEGNPLQQQAADIIAKDKTKKATTPPPAGGASMSKKQKGKRHLLLKRALVLRELESEARLIESFT